MDLLAGTSRVSQHTAQLNQIRSRLAEIPNPVRRDIAGSIHEALVLTADETPSVRQDLLERSRALDLNKRIVIPPF